MRQPHEVLVFLHRQGATGREVLVLHRVPPDAYWHGLAGGIEGDETPTEAALREVQEEVGLDLRATLVPTGHVYVYEIPDDVLMTIHYPAGTPVEISVFEASVDPGVEPVLNEEHDTYRWASFAEAAELLRWDDTREALVLLAAQLQDA